MFSRSKLNDTWAQDGMQIEIRGTPGIGGKIFGIPWLLFGVYFIYQWVIVGMIEYIRAGDIPGLIAGLWAWLLIFAGLFVIFVVPGWMLIFLRRKVMIDVSKAEVEEGNDFLVYCRMKTHTLKDFKRLVLVQTVSKSRDSRGHTRRTVFYDIRLSRGKPKDFVLAGTMQDEEKAEELGRALEKLTRLPFEIQEKSETRVDE